MNIQEFFEDNGITKKPKTRYQYNNSTHRHEAIEDASMGYELNVSCHAAVGSMLVSNMDRDVSYALYVKNLMGIFAVKIKSSEKYAFYTFQRGIRYGGVMIERIYFNDLERITTRIKNDLALSNIVPHEFKDEDFDTNIALVMIKFGGKRQ